MTSPREASAAVEAALTAVPNLAVFMGGLPDDVEVPRSIPGGPAKPYAAVFMGGGQVTSDRYPGLRPVSSGAALDLSLPFQVSAVAGTYDGALWAVGKVRLALTGVRLFDGATRLKEITQPGNVREDKTVPNDVRWYLPMQYRFTTTT